MKCPNCGAENLERKEFCGDCGARIGANGPSSSGQFVVNVLGLLGAVVGVIAVFSTWLRVFFFGEITYNLIDVARDASTDTLAFWAAILFILGTLTAFISSIGWAPQLAGVVLWWLYALDLQGEIPGRPGSYIALASAIMVFASMIRPIGPGLMTGPFRARNRLLVFSSGERAPQFPDENDERSETL